MITLGQGLPINSVQSLVRCTPNDLPISTEGGHSHSVPQPEKDYSGSSAGWWLWRHMTLVLRRFGAARQCGSAPVTDPTSVLDQHRRTTRRSVSKPRISKHAEYGAGSYRKGGGHRV